MDYGEVDEVLTFQMSEPYPNTQYGRSGSEEVSCILVGNNENTVGLNSKQRLPRRGRGQLGTTLDGS